MMSRLLSVFLSTVKFTGPQPLCFTAAQTGKPSASSPFVFNGDFVDRGSWSIEAGRGLTSSGLHARLSAWQVILSIFALKLKAAGNVLTHLAHGTASSRCHSLNHFIYPERHLQQQNQSAWHGLHGSQIRIRSPSS